MGDLLQIPIDGGGFLMVRTGDPAPADVGKIQTQGPVPAKRPEASELLERVVNSTENLHEILRPVVTASGVVLHTLAQAAPDEIEVEFGVELAAETGAILAKAGGACHLTVKLTWKPSEHPPAKNNTDPDRESSPVESQPSSSV
jgi:hypothetical protein